MLERILETIRTEGVPTDVPINVPITEAVRDLIDRHPGINRTKMAELLGVDVKTIGRALVVLDDV